MKKAISKLAVLMMTALLILSMFGTAYAAGGSIVLRRVTGDAQRNCVIRVNGDVQDAGDVYVSSFPVTVEVEPNDGYCVWAIYRDGYLYSNPNLHENEGIVQLTFDKPASEVNIAIIVYVKGAPMLKNTPEAYDARYAYGASGNPPQAGETTTPTETTPPEATQSPTEEFPSEPPITQLPETTEQPGPTQPPEQTTPAESGQATGSPPAEPPHEESPDEENTETNEPDGNQTTDEPVDENPTENQTGGDDLSPAPNSSTQLPSYSAPGQQEIGTQIHNGGVGNNLEQDTGNGGETLRLVLIFSGAVAVAIVAIIFIFKKRGNLK